MGAIHIVPAAHYDNLCDKISTIILARVMQKPDLVLSVFSGTPAFGLYRVLVDRAKREDIDFSQVRFVAIDEIITGNREAPFRRILNERLFAPLSVSPSNVVAFDPGNAEESEVHRISEWVTYVGIDVALLSTDSRGHIGFHSSGANPDSRAAIVPIENRARWKADRAFTLGLRDMVEAETVLLFSSGGNSAEVVRQLVEEPVDEAVPISVLQRRDMVVLVADRESLSRIGKTDGISGLYGGVLVLDQPSMPIGRKVLVVSPHPDDASISLGGTIAMLAIRNRVLVAVMSTGHRAFIYGTQRSERIAIREGEVKAEARVLGAEPRFLRLPFYDSNYEVSDRDVEMFSQVLEEMRPDWVFLPHSKDSHPAHRASRAIVLTALTAYGRESGCDVEVWNYEGPWAMFDKDEFNVISSVPNAFFEKKLNAIRAHESQIKRTPYHVAAESLARLRSSLVPEFALAGYGTQPPKLEPFLELFSREDKEVVDSFSKTDILQAKLK